MVTEQLLHEAGVLIEFPQQCRKRNPGKPQSQVLFNVYCKFRQIENGEMIQCDKCGEWNRLDVSSDHNVWKRAETIWLCEAYC